MLGLVVIRSDQKLRNRNRSWMILGLESHVTFKTLWVV
jgi:hypothetical protein